MVLEVLEKNNSIMEREDIFDQEFCDKLKAFYSYKEEYRRTGRTYKLAKILLETAIESGREICIRDHYLDVHGVANAEHNMFRQVEHIVYEYRDLGIEIKVDFDSRFNRFKAKVTGGMIYYNEVKNNPFPVRLIKEKIEFLNKQLLLLL